LSVGSSCDEYNLSKPSVFSEHIVSVAFLVFVISKRRRPGIDNHRVQFEGAPPFELRQRAVVRPQCQTGGRPKSSDSEEILELLPPGGLTAGEWMELAKSECGISDATFHRHRRALIAAELILKSTTSKKWQPITQNS
jgi:hypothetical protein